MNRGQPTHLHKSLAAVRVSILAHCIQEGKFPITLTKMMITHATQWQLLMIALKKFLTQYYGSGGGDFLNRI